MPNFFNRRLRLLRREIILSRSISGYFSHKFYHTSNSHLVDEISYIHDDAIAFHGAIIFLVMETFGLHFGKVGDHCRAKAVLRKGLRRAVVFGSVFLQAVNQM